MAIKKLGKKGIFLTFISISIMAALIIIFTPTDINLRKDIPIISTRVSNVNEFVVDLENVYLERTLQATGIKTINSLIRYMEVRNTFLTDFESDFKQVLLDGTIESPTLDIDTITGLTIMSDNTYNDWIDKITVIATDTFNVETTFIINSIQVDQTRPWYIDVEADISFEVISETATWNRNVLIKSEISIENFDDPHYIVNTGGSYINKIKQSQTKFDKWDVQNVKDFIRDGKYTHWQTSQAPSFLMRFTNDISQSSCCGIESLVNPNNPNILNPDVSYSDYQYWSTTPDCINGPTLFEELSINGINDEFPNIKFDLNHVALFKLFQDPSSNVQQICPPIT